MDGIELTRKIRKSKNGKNLPIMILTSIGSKEKIEDYSELKISSFLSKPIKQSQLQKNLAQILDYNNQIVNSTAKRKEAIDSGLAQKYNLKILLAEDNAVNQKVAMRMLSKMGYRADVVANGYEAVNAVRRISYDIVFMDILMPEMDGMEATKTIIEENKPDRQPKIIAMTANAMQGDREKCLNAGMHDYISKPVRAEEIQTKIMKWGTIISEEKSEYLNSIINKKVSGRLIDEDKISFLADLASDEDIQFYAELLDIYISELPLTIMRVKTAIKNEDQNDLKFAIHKLKGSSVTLGIDVVTEISLQLEKAAFENNFNSNTAALVDELTKKFEIILKELIMIKEKYSRIKL